MAVTTPTNVDSSIREVWAERVLSDSLLKAFFEQLVGLPGSGSPVIRQTELLNKPGDLIHIQTTDPLVGAGVSGDTTALAGSEEALATSEIKTSPILYRHGVRIYRRANKKSMIDLRQEARGRLAEHAAERMDDLRFAGYVSNAPVPGTGESQGAATTPDVHKVGGGSAVPTTLWVAADFNDIGVTDHLSVLELQKIRLKLYNKRAKPINDGGKPVYIGVVHPTSLFNLKRESEYRDWVREAHVRGEMNPMFRGATAMIDGMMIFEHPNVPRVTSGSGPKVSQNLFFGAEAFVEGLDENLDWVEDTFDYENEWGVAYSFAFQPRRARSFNSIQVWANADDIT
jgi:N4-gp56 family major capsid protein